MIMQGCVISCGTVVFFQISRNLSRSLLTNNNFYCERSGKYPIILPRFDAHGSFHQRSVAFRLICWFLSDQKMKRNASKFFLIGRCPSEMAFLSSVAFRCMHASSFFYFFQIKKLNGTRQNSPWLVYVRPSEMAFLMVSGKWQGRRSKYKWMIEIEYWGITQWEIRQM